MQNKTLIAIPIHKMDGVTAQLTERAIKSALAQTHSADIAIFSPIAAVEKAEKLESFKAIRATYEKMRDSEEWPEPFDFTFVNVDEGISFQKHCNIIASYAKNHEYSYFTILECDDVMLPKYISQCIQYLEDKEADVILPVTLCVEGGVENIGKERENVSAMANEVAWHPKAFTKEGWFDLEGLLKEGVLTLISNAFYRTTLFDDIATPGFKEGIKWKWDQEFVYRIVYQGAKVFVMPKLLAYHAVQREGSLIHKLAADMTPEMDAFWSKEIRKQFFFDNDREVMLPEEIDVKEA